jgi:two-component system response regulator
MSQMHDQIVDLLLVEDNPRDAEMIIRAIQRHKLANPVFVVEDGAEALDFLFARGRFAGRQADQRPRVILLDLKLPKVSGLEVLRQVKEHPSLASVPVVILTSSQEDPDIEAAYALGANSYVVKPVEFESFVEAISRVGLYWMIVNQPPR